MTRLAIVQEAPVLLDKPATLAKAASLVEQAAGAGAELIVFPEAFIPGYAAWIWRLRPGADLRLSEGIHHRLLSNAVDLSQDDLQPLLRAARTHGVTVVCGLNERDGTHSRSTLYNTVVVMGPDGTLLNRHRKLMPTNPERMVWGFGDATGLKVVDTPSGRLGALICWENFMPLARYALYAQGIDIYIAPTYDSGNGWIGTLQHIAREAKCWVVGSGVALRVRDIPDDFPSKATIYPESQDWINPGDSVLVAPGGDIVAGPMRQEQGILYAEIDSERSRAARRTLDIVGHYARPDIFQLQVNTQPQSPVRFV
jgi:nitrilase